MSTVQIIRYVVGPIRTNEYLVYCEDQSDAVIIDPGAPNSLLYDDIKRLGLIPKYIFLTHGHGDHTDGLNEAKENYPDIKLVASKKEHNFLFNRKYSNGQGGIIADIEVHDGDDLSIGTMSFNFIETPGHTPGSMCILIDDVLFSGDTLFFGSIGRTDLPGGNETLIIKSIKEKLMCLNDNITVLPGHMKETSIGFERSYNPFV